MNKINLTAIRLLVVALILMLMFLRASEVPFTYILMWLLYIPLIGVLVWRDFSDEEMKNNPILLVLGFFGNSLFVTSLYFTFLDYSGAVIIQLTTAVMLLLIVVFTSIRKMSTQYTFNAYLFFALFAAMTFLLKY